MGDVIIEGKSLGLDGLNLVKTFKKFEPLAESLKIKDPKKAWEDIEKALGRKKKGKRIENVTLTDTGDFR